MWAFCVLLGAVGVEELAGKVDDGLAVPVHDHARLLGDDGHDGRLEVFLGGGGDKLLGILGATTTAMRSCDSEMASSVPSRPSYFLVTLSRSMSRPSASSPMATDTPPAPKSLQRLMRRQASSRRNRRCSLRSMGALPFCTSAPQVLEDCPVVRLGGTGRAADAVTAGAAAQQDDHIAGARALAADVLAGVAPTTAPISMRLAT